MNEMKRCPRCFESKTQDDWQFCPRCGAELEEIGVGVNWTKIEVEMQPEQSEEQAEQEDV